MGRYLTVWTAYRDFPYKRAAVRLAAGTTPRLGLGDGHAVKRGSAETMCHLPFVVPTDAPMWPPAGGPRCPLCSQGTGVHDLTAGPVADEFGWKVDAMMDPAGDQPLTLIMASGAQGVASRTRDRGYLHISTTDHTFGPSSPARGDAPVPDRRGPTRPWVRRSPVI